MNNLYNQKKEGWIPWTTIWLLKVILFDDKLEIEADWFWQVVNNIVVGDVGATTLHEAPATVSLPGHVGVGAWSMFFFFIIIIFLLEFRKI